MLRRLLAVVPLAALVGMVVACASPTLPLPPPFAPTVSAGVDANHFKLTAPCGGAEDNMVIVIENTNAAVPDDLRVTGSITSGCGAWDATVYGSRGDVLNITQSDGITVSQPAEIQIPLH